MHKIVTFPMSITRSYRRCPETCCGVAILSRDGEPIVTRRVLPGDSDDWQSRYLEAAVNGMLIGCVYLPNGKPLRCTRTSGGDSQDICLRS